MDDVLERVTARRAELDAADERLAKELEAVRAGREELTCAERVLAARAEHLDRALKRIIRKGGHVVLLDGTLVRTQCRTGPDNRRNCSGKHKSHGLLFLGITDTRGQLVWISAARPGRSSSPDGSPQPARAPGRATTPAPRPATSG